MITARIVDVPTRISVFGIASADHRSSTGWLVWKLTSEVAVQGLRDVDPELRQVAPRRSPRSWISRSRPASESRGLPRIRSSDRVAGDAEQEEVEDQHEHQRADREQHLREDRPSLQRRLPVSACSGSAARTAGAPRAAGGSAAAPTTSAVTPIMNDDHPERARRSCCSPSARAAAAGAGASSSRTAGRRRRATAASRSRCPLRVTERLGVNE